MSTSHYISCADTAKELRKALKAHFPKTTFSVLSKTYSGGASISVRWTDGPTSGEVDRVAGHFAGATFDGMIDLKSHHDTLHNGELVQWGADYVFCYRKATIDLLTRVAVRVGKRWGVNLTPFLDCETHGLHPYLNTHKLYIALTEGDPRTETCRLFDHHTAMAIERAFNEALSTTRGNGVVVTLKPLPINPEPTREQVRHVDGDPRNNEISNLRLERAAAKLLAWPTAGGL